MSKEDNLNKGTIVINDIDAQSRDEMVCPECGHHSIEEHPSASEYPTKKAAILKASYCANSDCPRDRPLTVEEVQKQYNPQGINKYITKKSVLQLIIVLIGVVLIGSYFLGGPIHQTLFATPTTTVEGQVVNSSGQPVSDATVTLSGTDISVTTNANGSYTLQNVKVGTYLLSIKPPQNSDMRTFGTKVEITQSKGITVQGTAIPKKLYSTSNNTFTAQLPQPSPFSKTFKAQNITKTVTYIHPSNRSDVKVTVSPINQDELTSTTTTTFNLTNKKNLTVAGSVTNATATATGNITTEQFSEEKLTNSSGKVTFPIHGNITPKNATVTLGSNVAVSGQQKTTTVQSNDSVTIPVNGSVVGNMNITIFGGTTSAVKTKEGTWSPSDPSLSLTIDKSDAPSSTTLTLSGKITTEKGVKTGSLTNKEQTITIDPKGSLNPTNATISFSGGNIDSEQIAQTNVSATAESEQTVTKTNSIASVSKQGTYTIEYDFTIDKGAEFISGGYLINGTKHKVSQKSGTVSISLDAGDTAGLWITAKQEQLPTANHTGSSLEIRNVELSNKEIPAGEDVGVRATIDGSSGGKAVLYVDGVQQASKEVLSNEDSVVFRTSSLSEGVHSIQVNDSDVHVVRVGGAELQYGSGTLSGTLTYIAEKGTVSVDGNNDESADCTANASGGSCNLSLSNATNKITLTQHNVSNVDYKIQYTARYGPRDVKADLDNDGTYEINHSGPLTEDETVTATTTLKEGTHTIPIETSTKSSLKYTLKWTESGVIAKPSISVNGKQVISKDIVYQGKQKFEISGDHFNSGNNTVTFSFEDTSEHRVIFEWAEKGTSTYPILISEDGTTLCTPAQFAGDNSCDINPQQLTTGTQTFQLVREGSPVPNATLTFNHTARAVPQRLILHNVDTGSKTIFSKSNAHTKLSDGTWTQKKSVMLNADDAYKLKTTTQSQFKLSGSVSVTVTAKRSQAINPKIIITKPDGSSKTIEIPSTSLNSNGKLVKPATITIESGTFGRGVNKITFTAEKGVYTVKMSGTDDS